MSPKLAWLATPLLLACVHLAQVQQPTNPARLGAISGGSSSTDAHYHQAFLQSLTELGYVKDKTVFIEYRYAEGNRLRFAEFASEMVARKADVIIAGGATGVREAIKATSTIPIVMSNVSDPVALGFVKSLSRPGGNVTGLSTQAPELSGKRLELLKEIVPNLSRLAVLWQPGGPGSARRAKETETVARLSGLKTQMFEIKAPEEIDGAFASMKNNRADALIPLRSPLIGNHVDKIIERAAIQRVPVIYDEREFVEAGGLMFYNPDHLDLFRRAAVFLDKILKGAQPADLPVEQPNKFELVINLKTAKKIGLIVPPQVLARADRVIR